MSEKVKKFASVFAILIIILVMAIKAFKKNEPNDRPKNNKQKLDGSTLKSKTTPKDINLEQTALTIKLVNGEIPALEKTDYQILGRENIPLNLGKKTMLERIKNGINSMNLVEFKVYPDSQILTMEKAYERLIGSLSFLDSKFPIWGVDVDSFFVFSGQTGVEPDLVFKYGFAVKKDNGRIYTWFAPQ